MNGGRVSGWQRIGAAFWGLGAVLLLAGVAAASEAAPVAAMGAYQRKSCRIFSGAPSILWCSPAS